MDDYKIIVKDRVYKTSGNLAVFIAPNSAVSESYRRLRTRIQYLVTKKKLKTVLITSPDEQDGKSVTACNIAISMANAGNKVLLIDANLRRPSIHNQFFIASKIGLTNVLLGEITLESSLFRLDDIPGLAVLPSGSIPSNPSEILIGNRMAELLSNVSACFDMVIIDSPPIGPVSDGLVLAGLVDGVILTISSKKTKINMAENAVKALRKIDANILGVVFTKAKGKEKVYR